jgi:hypothetical protein
MLLCIFRSEIFEDQEVCLFACFLFVVESLTIFFLSLHYLLSSQLIKYVFCYFSFVGAIEAQNPLKNKHRVYDGMNII